MIKYRNKMVYDASTGELRDDRKHLSMLEDFWLPRREGGKGTEITTLSGGQNLGVIEDVVYFQKKLLNSLSVPVSRLEPQGGGLVGIGRTTEVTRDELKFNRFIERLRNKFTQLFDNALKIQLSLKGICTQEEWDEFKEFVFYDFVKNSNFAELRDSELLRERIGTLNQIDPYVGRYFSPTWVRKNVLKMTDEEIEEMDKEIQDEQDSVAMPQPEGGAPGDQGAEQPMPGQEQTGGLPPDNTQDQQETESMTPQLDADVNQTVFNINRKR
jgi:hypothetical protein